MAFNHHLESDSVGDIGFFNIVRAPIGLVLWALGGNNNDDDVCSTKEKTEHRFCEDIEGEGSTTNSLRYCSENLAGVNLNNGSPSMVRSEVSDMSNYQQEYLNERMAAVHLNAQQSSSCHLIKKKLSWSDENGKNLAIESTQKHEPRPEIAPQRSSMSRTRSVQNRMSGDENSRYLPKGLSKQQQDLVSSSQRTRVEPLPDSGSLESPQWGWYIRTTPPTPEMYYSRSLSKPTSSSSTVSTSSFTQNSPFSQIPTTSHPNPVFQGLQDRHKAAPIGWTGVPL